MKDSDNNYCVYCHTNKTNGKVYIGITNDIKQRWQGNGSRYIAGCDTAFGNAIKKYGWDGFEHTILDSDISFDEAKALEIKYIAEYKSNVNRYNNPAYGYNMTDGGEGFKGVPRFGERNSFYGKHHTDATKKKISESRKGANNPLYGRKISDDELHRLIDPKKKRVICVTTGEIFESASEAARRLNISESSISMCCNGIYCRVKNLVFRYEDNATLAVTHKRNSPRPVLCVETGTVYETTVAAAKATGARQAAIWDCCNERRKQTVAGGYTWRYATEDEIAQFIATQNL